MGLHGMSASEIRLALSYSIQKEAYIVTNTYQDVGSQPHTPYCTWWIFSQPHHAWPFLSPCRSLIPFSLKPIMILYCLRVIIVFHFQVPGPLSIWNMMEGWQVTDHPLFFFFFLCSIGNPGAIRVILAWLLPLNSQAMCTSPILRRLRWVLYIVDWLSPQRWVAWA